MGDSLEYPEVLQEVRGAMNPGRLKLQSSGVMFKNTKTGRMDQFQASEVEQAMWLIRARGHCLKLVLNNGSIHRYDGFREAEYEKLSNFISKNYDTDLKKRDVSTKGWNWGVANFIGSGLMFEVDSQEAFEVPLNHVSHTTASKNEVTLEFHQNDDAAVSLMELRFHIPTDANSEVDAVQEFHKNVLAKADIIQATGAGIVTFEDVQCLTPRGRYDVKVYPSFLQLHGKTFDYKIPFTTILRLFLLPHRDGRQIFFVISVDPPIKQGQTRYHFIVISFNKDDDTTVELGLTEEEIKEKFEGKLQKEMTGSEYEIVSRIMKTIVNRKITIPGSFVGNSGTQSISCSYKAATGFLYPLERGFIFVHKPPVHIRFDEIANVNFARSSGSLRSFDFEVETKTGSVFTFGGIEKEEYTKFYEFVTKKKLRVKNISGKKGPSYAEDDMDASDNEDDHDVYLQRMKREGKEREEDLDEDSDDEDDSDFNPEGSGSEVAEEYDTNAESSSSSSDEYSGSASGSEAEEARRQRKEKKKKEKEKRKTITIKEPGTKKRKRKTKKERDPDRPKRPQTAYMLWFNESRPHLKEENPGLSVTELSKKAGEAWKTVTDKSKWEEEAGKLKEKYQEAMVEYKEKQKDNPKPKAASKSPKKSPKKGSDTKAGSGDQYKSKEFISSSESSDEDKPLSKKQKTAPKNEGSDDEASPPPSGDESDEASAPGSESD